MTQKSQEALMGASALAERSQHSEVQPEHLLLALLQQEAGVVVQVLNKLSVDVARLSNDVRQAIAAFPSMTAVLTPVSTIAFPWYVLIGTGITLFIGILASLTHAAPAPAARSDRAST
jgi:hypothetical protein